MSQQAQAAAQNMEELELVLEFSPFTDEVKNTIKEHSVEMFKFVKHLKGKYPNVRQEIFDQRIGMYIQSQLVEMQKDGREDELEDIPLVMEQLSTQYAKNEGYENPDKLGEAFSSILDCIGALEQQA